MADEFVKYSSVSLNASSFPSTEFYENFTVVYNETESTSETNSTYTLPQIFTEISPSSKVCVIVYSVLFCIASAGNLSVFITVYRQYRRVKSRISLLILHLAVADLIVSVCLIPIEIFWRIFIQWYGGSLLCKLCQFFRAFGLYLSSMVLICISFDRFFAILYPFRVMEGMHRVKVMLRTAWVAAFLFSAPQTIIFDVVSHPDFPAFRQCVTKSFLSKPEDLRLYSIFSVSAMYFAPLIVIIFTYTMISCKIIRKSKEQNSGRTNAPPDHSLNISSHFRSASVKGLLHLKRTNTSRGRGSANCADKESDCELSHSNSVERNGKGSESPESRYKSMVLRRSDNAASNISRAKGRTLRLTVIIVCVFVFCWTPYVVMTLWFCSALFVMTNFGESFYISVACCSRYMFDWKGAKEVNHNIQDALFVFAVSNSTFNPIVYYGSYSKNCFGLSKLCCRKSSEPVLKRKGTVRSMATTPQSVTLLTISGNVDSPQDTCKEIN